jgi:exonuclease SbcC
MQIKSLHIQNIRSYVDETILLPDGSVLLAGDIGAGKTTILLAIEFALFGALRSELEASSLLRNGCAAGRIELTADIQGKEVRINRTLKRTATTVKQEAGFISLQQQRIDATPTELRARIVELLGYPKEALTKTKGLLYRYTVFTPQEQMRQILYDEKEVRLGILRKVFQIDKYKRIQENAALIAKALRTESRIVKETLTDLPQLLEQKELYEKQSNDLAVQGEQERIRRNEIHALVKEQEMHLVHIEVQQKEIYALLEKKAVCVAAKEKNYDERLFLEKKWNDIASQRVQLEKVLAVTLEKPTPIAREELEKQIPALERTLQEQKQQRLLLLQEHATLQKQRGVFQKEQIALQEALSYKKSYEEELVVLQKCGEQKAALEKRMQETEEALAAVTKTMAAFTVQKQTAGESIKRIPSLETCTFCFQAVSSDHKHLILETQQKQYHDAQEKEQMIAREKEDVQRQMDKDKKQMRELVIAEKKNAVLLNVLEGLEQKEKEKHTKELELHCIEERFFEVSRGLEAIQTENLNAMEKELLEQKALLQKISAWEKALLERKNTEVLFQEKSLQKQQLEKELQEREGQQLRVVNELLTIENALKQYGDIEETYKKQKHALQEIQQKEKQQEILMITIEKEMQRIQEQKTHIEKDLQTKQERAARTQRMDLFVRWIEEYFIPLVATMEKQVMLQVHAAFAAVFTSWFSLLMDDTSITARLDEEFTPVIDQNGYDTALLDLSGGEKTAVALAYRLALNKVINDFMTTIHTRDLIILDEPTDGFSARQLDKVREVLDELKMRQIILVSHESKIESFVDHVLRIEKIGHVSRVLQ